MYRSLKSEGLRLPNLSSLFFSRVLPEAGPEKAFCVLGAGALNKLYKREKQILGGNTAKTCDLRVRILDV